MGKGEEFSGAERTFKLEGEKTLNIGGSEKKGFAQDICERDI